MKKIITFVLLVCVSGVYAINFGSQDAAISLINGSYTTFIPEPDVTGTIKRDFASTFAREISFNNGIYSEGSSKMILTGTFDATYSYSVQLSGSSSIQVLSNDVFYSRILVSGSNNTIEGYPTFNTPDAITLSNSSSELTLFLDSNLSQNINFPNGGSLILGQDLSLGQGVIFKSPNTSQHAQITLGGNNLFFGTQDTTWTDTLVWINGENIVLGGNTRLTGEWIFQGDAIINGASNTLNFSAGGIIRVTSGSTLKIRNLVLKGLGSGSFVFDDDTATLDLFGCSVIMDNDFINSSGQWYANGPITIITGNNLLSFNSSSLLTVDGAVIEYNTLDFLDQNNIQFGSLSSNSSFVNGGSIRKTQSLKLGDHIFTSDSQLDREFIISPLRRLLIQGNAAINGAGFNFQFARNPSAPILSVSDGVKASFNNILLRDFPVNSAYTSYGTNSQLIFDDQTNIELGNSGTLTTTWYIKGAVAINGNGKVLDFGSNGNIVLRPGASLLLDNVTLRGLYGYKIRAMDNRCTLSLGDVTWKQSANFTFTNSHFEVVGVWDLVGSSTFQYSTTKTSTITSFGTLLVDDGMTFRYAPTVANRRLLYLQDSNALLKIDGGSLSVTTTGLQLTNGTVAFTNGAAFKNVDATSQSQGLIIGNGDSANEVTLIYDAWDVQSGRITFLDSSI